MQGCTVRWRAVPPGRSVSGLVAGSARAGADARSVDMRGLATCMTEGRPGEGAHRTGGGRSYAARVGLPPAGSGGVSGPTGPVRVLSGVHDGQASASSDEFPGHRDGDDGGRAYVRQPGPPSALASTRRPLLTRSGRRRTDRNLTRQQPRDRSPGRVTTPVSRGGEVQRARRDRR